MRHVYNELDSATSSRDCDDDGGAAALYKQWRFHWVAAKLCSAHEDNKWLGLVNGKSACISLEGGGNNLHAYLNCSFLPRPPPLFLSCTLPYRRTAARYLINTPRPWGVELAWLLPETSLYHYYCTFFSHSPVPVLPTPQIAGLGY